MQAALSAFSSDADLARANSSSYSWTEKPFTSAGVTISPASRSADAACSDRVAEGLGSPVDLSASSPPPHAVSAARQRTARAGTERFTKGLLVSLWGWWGGG